MGFDAANGRKVILTVVFFLVLYFVGKGLRAIAQKIGGSRQETAFWTRQGISLITFLLGVIGFLSIWFDNPTRLATGIGLLGAGLAFALQKVVTSFAGYFVILRGKTFNVGDRISMGGARRCHRAELYPDSNHGNGRASLRPESGSWHVGDEPSVFRPDRNHIQRADL